MTINDRGTRLYKCDERSVAQSPRARFRNRRGIDSRPRFWQVFNGTRREIERLAREIIRARFLGRDKIRVRTISAPGIFGSRRNENSPRICAPGFAQIRSGTLFLEAERVSRIYATCNTVLKDSSQNIFRLEGTSARALFIRAQRWRLIRVSLDAMKINQTKCNTFPYTARTPRRVQFAVVLARHIVANSSHLSRRAAARPRAY